MRSVYDSPPQQHPPKIEYKYNEGALIEELKRYIDDTYKEHYAQAKTQTSEFIIQNGLGIGFTVGNIIKYAQRYGKKDGRNRKDILKVLHYAIMMLYTHDVETHNETVSKYSNMDISDKEFLAQAQKNPTPSKSIKQI